MCAGPATQINPHSAVMSEATAKDCLRGAWEALRRGDTGERDRLCERARILNEAEDLARRIERVMQVDFYVNSRGTAYSTRAMAQAAGHLQ